MKSIWKFIISFATGTVLLTVLSLPFQLGTASLPPVGNFLNPFSGFWAQAESGKAGTHEFIDTEIISDSVQVYFDQRMIPHIFSTNLSDLFFAQGYLHAQNRLFQMELTCRSVMGTLSEVLGTATLENDIFARRMNFRKAVDSKLVSWQKHPQMIELLNAYCNGINRYIEDLHPKNYPLEYKLLHIHPERWSLNKTAAISISLSVTLNLEMEDIKYSHLLKQLDTELFQHLFPQFPLDYRPIVTDSVKYPNRKSLYEMVPNETENEYHIDYPVPSSPKVGSNNWAVRAGLTQDSFPILANDPHLPLTLPSIWYENHLHSKDLNAYGVTVPGMPGIIIGFNDHIAWGLTNASIDVADAYRIEWTDRPNGMYNMNGNTTAATKRVEMIPVKGKEPHVETILDTYWGPVLTDKHGTGEDIAVKWISHYPNAHCDFKMLVDLMKSRDLEDYQNAIKNFYTPGQNIIFASDQDSIALTVQGLFPVKRHGQGRYVQDGSNTTNDWKGFIPQNELPGTINPPEGFIVSANEWPVYENYPYYYSGNFDHYRGRTVANLLQNHTAITLKDMENIQNSFFNLKASEILPVFISLIPRSLPGEDWLQKLEDWDFIYNPQSPLPILSEMWIDHTIRLTFDEIPAEPTEETGYPEDWRLLEIITHDNRDPVFDIIATGKVKEDAREILEKSWKKTLEQFNNLDHQLQQWGTYSPLSISHLLRIPSFSHDSLFTGGNGNTINAITKTHGPSWKMIVELRGDSTVARVVYPGGQSGNPGSKFYDNFLNTWQEGRYYTVELKNSPRKIKNKIPYTLTFLPL